MKLLDPSLSLVIAFVLKSILCGKSIATPAFFVSILMKHLFPSLYLQSVSFDLSRVCRRHM